MISDLAGTVQVPADEGQPPQVAARQDAEGKWQSSKDGRRIHVREVIAAIDGDRMLVNDVQACDVDGRASDAQTGAGPCLCDAVLAPTVCLGQGRQQRHTGFPGALHRTRP